MSIELFVRYGEWFQQQLVPDVETLQVRRLERMGRGYRLMLSDGDELVTEVVVMASGLNGFARVPQELATAAGQQGLTPEGLVSHSSQNRDLSRFAGREVAVIGAGQSALESAALLHESGASAQVIARSQVRWGLPPKPPRSGLLSTLPEPNSPLGPTWRSTRSVTLR